MTRVRLTTRESLFVGVALFSMFFGAGNLIVPPLLGLQAGDAVVPAMIGFLVTGVGLPILGVVAVGLAGDIRKLTSRVHPLFAVVFVAAVYLAIGPCLAIPRTSSTAFEMIAPLLPAGTTVELPRLLFSVAFFAVAFLLAMHPSDLTKLLGRITGPLLIGLIVAVVGASLFDPATSLPSAHEAYAMPVMQGFLTGYQTMDLLASLTFGIVIAANIREFGVSGDAGLVREVSKAGILAGLLMGVIYCGFAAVGASLAMSMPGAANGAEIITASATAHFGTAGTVVVAAIFLLACLNVCIGLVSCCGTYFAEQVPQVPYRMWALVFAAFSCAVSNIGLNAILTFSVPLLNALYPMAIVLVVMGMLHKACDRVPVVWPWAVGLTGVVSVATAVRDAFFPDTWLAFDALPFASLGLNWAVPAVLGVAIGVACSLAASGRGRIAKRGMSR